jgi:hypothetical protein
MYNKERFSLIALSKQILSAGFLVGTLDILAALIKYYITTGKNPLFIFKYIASGILGPAAFTGSTGTILTGLLLHYFIALSFTCLFFALYFKIKWLSKHKILTGIAYGVFMWAVMAFLVVPLSHTPKGPFNMGAALKELLILILMIGLPLAFLAGRFLSLKENDSSDTFANK